MRWKIEKIISLITIIALVCASEVNQQRVKRHFLMHLVSTKAREFLEKIGNVSASVVEGIGDVKAKAIKPISPNAAQVVNKVWDDVGETVEKGGNLTADVVGGTLEIGENVAESIYNFTFSDGEIYDIEKDLAHLMGIKPNKNADITKARNLLTEFFSPTAKFLSRERTTCKLCQTLVWGLTSNIFPISKVSEFICNIYILLSTHTTTEFCKSIIELNKPILTYVIKNSKILDPELACTILLQSKQCNYEKPALQWVTKASQSSPKYPQHIGDNNEEPLTIIHLSDFHITPDYEVNGVSDCGFPVCCKKGLGNTKWGQDAGRWGDYNCDIPTWLLTNTLEHIKSTYKNINMVYFTGDIVDHYVWNTSVKYNSDLFNFAFESLKNAFPGVKVYPVIGNHESHPLNQFNPPIQDIENNGLSSQWVYTAMSEAWKPWLPPEALETVRRQGYYAHSHSPRLKIIGLHNNVCYNFNWWLMLNTEFLKEQLEFLNKELEESERNGQFVHILGHVSVGNNECIYPWEVSYNAIIERFAHIIKGQFVGHTHTDELKIFYDKQMRPINMAYNGASLTTYMKYNPNYKVMYVSPSTMDIIDIETYTFNLTEANMRSQSSPVWFKLYSMREAYGLTNLSAVNFDVFADKLLRDSGLQDQYWRYYVREGDESLAEGCDQSCRKEITCKVVTTVSSYPSKSICST